jgi:glycosyltransferase A (GT-A) superfamily protein (DUF2064 family)
MIRNALIKAAGDISADKLKTALDMATLDIMANRYYFKKRTSFTEAVRISGMCLKVLQNRTANG